MRFFPISALHFPSVLFPCFVQWLFCLEVVRCSPWPLCCFIGAISACAQSLGLLHELGNRKTVTFFRFTDYEMEILERVTYLYQKFSHLRIDKEEYVIMKVINFLNQGTSERIIAPSTLCPLVLWPHIARTQLRLTRTRHRNSWCKRSWRAVDSGAAHQAKAGAVFLRKSRSVTLLAAPSTIHDTPRFFFCYQFGFFSRVVFSFAALMQLPLHEQSSKSYVRFPRDAWHNLSQNEMSLLLRNMRTGNSDCFEAYFCI